MRHRKSHQFITNQMFPFLDPHLISAVDAATDNPTPMDVIFADMQRQMSSQVFIPTMWKGGHRQYNHDVFGALLKGYEKGGTDCYAAIAHLMADSVKDNLGKQLRVYGADMLESMMMFLNEKKRALKCDVECRIRHSG